MRIIFVYLITLAMAISCSTSNNPSQASPNTTLISNATIIDGTGSSAFVSDVRIVGDAILEIGELQPRNGEALIRADGLTLTPGFIDTHSHHDRGLERNRGALPLLTQGITTTVFGVDGGHSYPISDFFDSYEESPASVNIASYVGHNSIRRIVMGDQSNREATSSEIQVMSVILLEELESGALGLSSGLEYEPGLYSDISELLVLAELTAEVGGRYSSHIRSEDRYIWEAVNELIEIGRNTGMPIHYSHMKLAGKAFWGQGETLLDMLTEARKEGINITADIYPYEYWQSTIMVLLPDRNPDNLEEIDFVLREIVPADGIIFTEFKPNGSYVGKSVSEIATIRGTSETQTLSDLMKEAITWSDSNGGQSSESIMGKSIQNDDIEQLIHWPFVNICSDGAYSGHPRGHGSFPRVLAAYVREKNILNLEEAIRKMTSLAAEAIGVDDRGHIAPGMKADLVLFDATSIQDHASVEQAEVASTGISYVWVNGVLVLADGKISERRPGKILRRQ